MSSVLAVDLLLGPDAHIVVAGPCDVYIDSLTHINASTPGVMRRLAGALAEAADKQDAASAREAVPSS